jgi:DNA (cytosine-5)-methyltransferase 3A
MIAEPVCGALRGRYKIDGVRQDHKQIYKGQAGRIYSVKGKSVALCANGGGAGAKTGLYKIVLPDGDYIIRKLTPLECERLQTLPENYTNYVSNTQRYKGIGNGWTIDVIAHILKYLGGIK